MRNCEISAGEGVVIVRQQSSGELVLMSHDDVLALLDVARQLGWASPEK